MRVNFIFWSVWDRRFVHIGRAIVVIYQRYLQLYTYGYTYVSYVTM